SEHGQYPLDTIRRPDADAFARVESAGYQPACDPLDLAIEFGECESRRLERHHERGAVRHLVEGGLQHAVHGAIEQRLIAGARHETQGGPVTGGARTS